MAGCGSGLVNAMMLLLQHKSLKLDDTGDGSTLPVRAGKSE
jgi:hypothetical protein